MKGTGSVGSARAAEAVCGLSEALRHTERALDLWPLVPGAEKLAGADLATAQAIARVVRERDGGFPGVRALGLELRSAGRVQVSMNVEDWQAAALHEIVAAIALMIWKLRTCVACNWVSSASTVPARRWPR